ncbi:MAG: hypothetical protein HRU21_09815 [Pseudomonadales bacterium]|nr:hypothetical protein [Pseudomonadales bacterium]
MNYLVTYCDDLPALQVWLEANAEGNEAHIYHCRDGFSHDYAGYVFIFMPRTETLHDETGTMTMCFVVADDLTLALIESSPLQILGQGLTPESPYEAILADEVALAKYRTVISEVRQVDEFGSDFNFCRIA